MEVHMEKDKKVTALYCRLSKDDGSNSESLSIRTQKAMLMEYATRNGFGNCQYYVDDGYSGTNSDRPAFQELLDDIREGKVATVITKDQSRLGRNHIETGTYMEIFFPEHGVRYIAINDGYDSNEQSQMDIAPFRNIINEMYAKDTSRKIKSALRTRKKSGKYISSGAPFGYQKDPADHNHLVIDPNTAPVVEYIYSMAEEGLGLHRIAKRLHDEKVLKPCYYKKEMFGRFIDDEKMYDWDSAYISQVLHSPVYAGHIIYEAKPTVSMKSKKRRYIPFEERAIVPNIQHFVSLIRKYKNPTEVSDLMFTELIDKIVVYESEGVGKARTQKVDIYFNYVGQVDIAYTEEELAEIKEQEEQAEKKRLEKQCQREKAYREKQKAKKLAENGGEIVKTKVCPHCQKEFIPTSNRQIFCSKDCCYQARQDKTKADREAEKGNHYYRQRVCAVCGSTYWPTHSQQKFCSAECKKVNHNKKTLEFYYKKQKEKELCKDLLQTKEQVSDTNSSEITIIPA
ncbi:MAG: recombinase family protein [Faecalibacterium prausnitzii]